MEAKKADTSTAEGFVGSVFKYSISTFVSIGIFGVALLLTNFFVSEEVNGQIGIFTQWTNTIMTLGILGLDQALIRFYYKPPNGLTSNGLFRVCFYLSSLILMVAGVVCSTLLLQPIYNALGFSMVGHGVIPLLFLNAFFFMVLRYFNVLYRMEMNVMVYTLESVFMQLFYKLFYMLGLVFGFENPVPAMMACSLIGLGGFALLFSILRRTVLRPHRAEFSSGAYKTLVPYGAAMAPSAVFNAMSFSVPLSIITGVIGESSAGVYSYAYSLSSAVTLIQGGFASFWGAYMFGNYETEQRRIRRVHDYLNFVILCFFVFLVAFEDVLFFVLAGYSAAMPIFPVLMLGAVFTILCETTVYGNAIAKRPIFDTIGIGLSFGTNMLLCALLVKPFGLYGAAIAVAGGTFVMFLFRTFTAQRFYKSIDSPLRTAVAVAMAILVAVLGTLLTGQFLIKLALCALAVGLYCLLYMGQLKGLWKLGMSILKSIFKRHKA